MNVPHFVYPLAGWQTSGLLPLLSIMNNTSMSTQYKFFFFFINLSIYFYFWLRWVFVAARGLFSSCGEWGLLFLAVSRLLTAVASLVAEHGLQ